MNNPINMHLHQSDIEAKVDEIFSMYEKYGNEEYGEDVTQLMHMMQSANCAIKEGASNEMVIAAFLHDIGHFLEGKEDMGGYGRQDHDHLGAEYLLNSGFPERLAKLVNSHVSTKRYLTFKDQNYLNELSEASKITLKFQGGPMSATEALAFEADPMKELYIKIRLWDDLGKETGLLVTKDEIMNMKQRVTDYLMQVYEVRE
ncbi:HDIG domain-containing metalloprotein [Pedobacter sp. B4-66]|uniref:HD domain-containing protein n=1 Tax=Pedobacter sp. B4-66 TaxID=2817280 RepID=UPI0020246571|nr:HDIG domain-containing metalloprotein [Pedobacter sp. B4-66]